MIGCGTGGARNACRERPPTEESVAHQPGNGVGGPTAVPGAELLPGGIFTREILTGISPGYNYRGMCRVEAVRPSKSREIPAGTRACCARSAYARGGS
jgi:hypothetical protein